VARSDSGGLGRRDGDEAAVTEVGGTAGNADGKASGAAGEAPIFEFTDETFVLDLARAREGTLDATVRSELVGHLRRLLAEFDVAA